MSGTDIQYPFPLIRLNPLYPGQFGVPGAWTDTGLRTNPQGTVFYVDPQHPDANDQRDGTDPTAPLATVTRALALCRDDAEDVILVSSFVTEDVVCTVDGVRFIGVQHGTYGIPWIPTVDGTALLLGGQDCLVEGFEFFGNGASTGIRVQYTPAPIYCDYDVIRNCTFRGQTNGIVLDFSFYIAIHNCLFTDCMYGIQGMDNAELRAYIYDNLFHNCGVSAVAGAIWLPGMDSAFIHRNQIYHIDPAIGGAPATDMFINLTGGFENLVSRNVLSCLLPTGVPASGDYDDTCSPGLGDAWVQNFCMNGPTLTNPA